MISQDSQSFSFRSNTLLIRTLHFQLKRERRKNRVATVQHHHHLLLYVTTTIATTTQESTHSRICGQSQPFPFLYSYFVCEFVLSVFNTCFRQSYLFVVLPSPSSPETDGCQLLLLVKKINNKDRTKICYGLLAATSYAYCTQFAYLLG